jgi:hypothetical protein
MYHYSKQMTTREYQLYLITRMEAANERMLTAPTAEERIRAGDWVAAWSVLAGADPPARFKRRR